MYIGKRQSAWGSLVVVALAALGFAAAALISVDVTCRRDIARRLPLYPGASLESSEHDFLRVRAAGQSNQVFATPDTPETVGEWYRQLNLDLLEREQMRGLADVSRRYEADPVGSGTLIYYATRCGL